MQTKKLSPTLEKRAILENEIDLLTQTLEQYERNLDVLVMSTDKIADIHEQRMHQSEIEGTRAKKLETLRALHGKMGEYVRTLRSGRQKEQFFEQMRKVAKKIGDMGGWKSETVKRDEFVGGCERCVEAAMQRALVRELQINRPDAKKSGKNR